MKIKLPHLLLSLFFVLNQLNLPVHCQSIRIGALFTEDDIEERVALLEAVNRVNAFNASRNFKHIEIQPVIKTIQHTDILDVKEKACELLRTGVAAIFGPLQTRPATLVQTIADKYEIPHILLRNDFIFTREKISINMYPNEFSTIRAIIDLVKHLQWDKFAVVYENNEDAIYANEFLKAAREEFKYNDLKDGKMKVMPRNWNVKIMQFKPNLEYSDTFWELFKEDLFHFIIICKKENLYRIMKWAQQTGMVMYRYHFVVASLDMHSIPLEEFSYAKSNIYYYKLTNEQNTELVRNHYWKCRMQRCQNLPFDENFLSTTAALIYDGVHLLAHALREAKMNSKVIEVERLECGRDRTWSYGTSFINLMRSVRTRGLTGNIEFDQTTYRTKIELNLMRLEQNTLVKIGRWSEDQRGTYLIKEKPLLLEQIPSGPLLSGKKLKLLTAKKDPYTMLKQSKEELIGNDRYEGYVIDLITELSKILKFEFEILIHPDTDYGSCTPDAGCTGMLGRVTSGEVDMATVDLTITAERQSAVDFSLPFMNTGIGVLYWKITKQNFSLFSFMDPFSPGVWIALFLLTSTSALTLHVIGRISPYEWFNPYPCKQDEDILENSYNIRNSVWYINGALLQQGSEFAPRSSSTRWTAGVWYFVTLILYSSYTANLAAFLTVVNFEYPFKQATDLLYHPEIKFGCKDGGSTCYFFRDSDNKSDYKKMWHHMELSKEEEGINRITTDAGKFAFFLESKAIEYIQERNCTVTQVGNLLDNKGYGIAVNKHNKTLKRQLDEGILNLQEGGMLHVLYDRWWKQKGGGVCVGSTTSANILDIGNVGGVFVVLIVGVVFSIIGALVELVFKIYKSPVASEQPLKEAVKKELRFAFDIRVPKKITPKAESLRTQSIPNQSSQSLLSPKATEPKTSIGSKRSIEPKTSTELKTSIDPKRSPEPKRNTEAKASFGPKATVEPKINVSPKISAGPKTSNL